MKKSIAFTGAVIVVIAVITLLRVLHGDGGLQKIDVDLYFLNESGTSIVAQKKEIRYRDLEELPRQVVGELIKGPDDGKKLKRIMGSKTQLLSLNMQDKHSAVVDFTASFLTDDTSSNLLAAYAVVKTLCGVNTIQSVKVTVEGREIHAADGNAVGFLSAEDINLATDTYNSETREIVLYFASKTEHLLGREVRPVKITDQQPLEQYIINELIKGPEDKELSPVLSPETTVLSVETLDNVCYVNFKSSFIDKNAGNSQKERLAIYAVINSLTELDYIARVQLLIDGKKTENFGTIKINDLLGRDASMIQ